jgi:hypothetical protein
MLTDLQLEHLVKTFRESGINGRDLQETDEQELQDCLGLNVLQARKIKKQVDAISGGAVMAHASVPTHVSVPHPVTPPRPLVTWQTQPVPAGKASKVDPVKLQEYGSITKRINQLQSEQVEQAVGGYAAQVQGLQQTLQAYQRQLQEDQAKAAKKAEKLQDMSEGTWYPGKHLRGKGHHHEKQQLAEQAAAETASATKQTAAQVAQLQGQVATQTRALHDARAKVAELHGLRAAEEKLLQEVFAGRTAASDDREDNLEAQLAALVPRLQERQQALSNVLVGSRAMEAATQQLQGAKEEMQRAFGLSGLDMANDFFRPGIGPGGLGGLAADVAKRRRMETAQQLTTAAAANIQKARSVLPQLPGIDQANLSGLNKMWGDVVFDNIFSDMRMRQRIRENMARIDAMAMQANHSMRWAQGVVTQIQGEVSGLQTQQATVAAELHSYRLHLLDMAAARS